MANQVETVDQELAKENGHYQALMDRHQALDDQIDTVEQGRDHLDDLELSRLKRERLYVKQQMEFLRRRHRPDGP
jgi:hypothetical protein